ncbi:unnamed protein product [Pedinophyceae sp. YPF-701]|nr:unnamed protein product [Pedinophyceae sp. YPF-701]
MGDDVQLQSAILASLQGQGRIPPTQPSRPLARAGSSNHGALARDGIRPVGGGNRAANARAGNRAISPVKRRSTPSNNTSGRGTPSTSKKELAVSGTTTSKFPQWSRWMGSGYVTAIVDDDGTSRGKMEGISGEACALLYDAPAKDVADAIKAGCFRAQFTFKTGHTPPGAKHPPSFSVILGAPSGGVAGSSPDALVLRADCRDRFWALEQVSSKGDVRLLHQAEDRELRPGTQVQCRVEVREGAHLTVFNGATRVMDGVATPMDEPQHTGGKALVPVLGLMVTRSRLEWSAFSVEPAAGGVPSQVDPSGKLASMDALLVEMIERDVISTDLGITFDDIASLDTAKRLLNEAVSLPLIVPEFFTGIREPWKGILLFGPPGTGKTLLAKAVAGMNGVKFFNCSPATMTSKWRGESEKLCRTLFSLARHHAPSIIFFDEVDALVTSRGMDGEHEASRRFKSELLSQMDGITSDAAPGKNVVVVATTNIPWDLDDAMRRRLEKRIYVPLPDAEARAAMFRLHLKGLRTDGNIDVDWLVERSEGMSGADIKLLCRDASMMPMRRLIVDRTPLEIREMRDKGMLAPENVATIMEDFRAALANMSGSVSQKDVQRFEKWNKEYAST